MEYSKFPALEYAQTKRRRKTRDAAGGQELREPPNPRGGSDKQLAIARLAASYKGECKKLFRDLHCRQDGWLKAMVKNGQLAPGILPGVPLVATKPPLPPALKLPAAAPPAPATSSQVTLPVASTYMNPVGPPPAHPPVPAAVNPVLLAHVNPVVQALVNPVAQVLANLVLPGHVNPVLSAQMNAVAPQMNPVSAAQVNLVVPSQMNPDSTAQINPTSTAQDNPNLTPQVNPNSTPQVNAAVAPQMLPMSMPQINPAVQSQVNLVLPAQVTSNPMAHAIPNSTAQINPNSTAQVNPNSTSQLIPISTPQLNPAVSLPPQMIPMSAAQTHSQAQSQANSILLPQATSVAPPPVHPTSAAQLSPVVPPPMMPSSMAQVIPVSQPQGNVAVTAQANSAALPHASPAVSAHANAVAPPQVSHVAVPHVPHPWKQAERDALKRAVLSFGVGRWVKLHMCMLGEKACSSMTHTVQDVEVATYEFLQELCKWVDEADAAVLQPLIKPASRQPAPATQGGQWSKVETAAKLYVKRVKMLDDFNHMMCRLSDSSLMSVFQQTLHSMPDSNPPALWWTSEADLALLYGVYKLGYGNYESIRDDPEFSQTFVAAYQGRPVGQKGSATDLSVVPFDEWPATDVLTRRFKRLCDHLMRAGRTVEQQDAKKKKEEEKAREQLWSKKERVELLKWILTWGPPPPLVDPNSEGAAATAEPNTQATDLSSRWSYLTAHPLLVKKTPASVERVYTELMGEMEEVTGSGCKSLRKARHPEGCPCAVCGNRRKGLLKKLAEGGEEAAAEEEGEDTEEEDDGQGAPEAGANRGGEEGEQKEEKEEDVVADGEGGGKKKQRRPRGSINRVLTTLTAARLKERLEVLQVLKQGAAKLKPLWSTQLVLVNRVALLPTWWRPNHDADLVAGVLKYGFGNWEEILNDPSLSFKASARNHASDSAGAQRVGDPGGSDNKTPNSHAPKVEGADKEDEAEEGEEEKEEDKKDDCSTASEAEMAEGGKEKLLEHWMPESRALGKRCRMIANVMKRMLKKAKYFKIQERPGGRGGRGGRGASAGRGDGGGHGRGTRIKVELGDKEGIKSEAHGEGSQPSTSPNTLPHSLAFPLSNPTQQKAVQEEQERMFHLYAQAEANAQILSQTRHRGSTPDSVYRKPSTPSYLTPTRAPGSPGGALHPETLFTGQQPGQGAVVKQQVSDDTESVTKSMEMSDQEEEVEKRTDGREHRQAAALQLDGPATHAGAAAGAYRQQLTAQQIGVKMEDGAREEGQRHEQQGYGREVSRGGMYGDGARGHGMPGMPGLSPERARHDGTGGDMPQGRGVARSAPVGGPEGADRWMDAGMSGGGGRKRPRAGEESQVQRSLAEQMRGATPPGPRSPLNLSEMEEGGIPAAGTAHGDATGMKGRSKEVGDGGKGAAKQKGAVNPLALEIAMSVLGEISAKGEPTGGKARRGRARSHQQAASTPLAPGGAEGDAALPPKRKRTIPAKYNDEEGYVTKPKSRRQSSKAAHASHAPAANTPIADDNTPRAAAGHDDEDSPASAETEDDIPMARKTVSLNSARALGGMSARKPRKQQQGYRNEKQRSRGRGDAGVGEGEAGGEGGDGVFEEGEGARGNQAGKRQPRVGGKGRSHQADEGAGNDGAADAGMGIKRRRISSGETELLVPAPPRKAAVQASIAYQNIPRDQYGRPVLPLQVNTHLTLISLGRVEYELPGFYNSRTIFPVGFKTRRRSSSLVHRDGITSYTCEILEHDGRPCFRVVPDDAPHLEFAHSDPTTPWVKVFEAVHAKRGLQNMDASINGADLFGLTDPLVARLIHEIPGAELCSNSGPDRPYVGPPPTQHTHGASALARPKQHPTERQSLPADSDPEWHDPLKQQAKARQEWGQQQMSGKGSVEAQQLAGRDQAGGKQSGVGEGYEGDDAPPTPPKFKSSAEVPLSRMLQQHRHPGSADSDLLVDVTDNRWGDAQGHVWGAKLLSTGAGSPSSMVHGAPAQVAPQPIVQDPFRQAEQLPEFIQRGRGVDLSSHWQHDMGQGGRALSGLSWDQGREHELLQLRQQEAANLARKGRKLDLSGEHAGRLEGHAWEEGVPDRVDRQREVVAAPGASNPWSLNHVSSINLPTVSNALASKRPPRPQLHNEGVAGMGVGETMSGYELELAAQMLAYNTRGALNYERGVQPSVEGLQQARAHAGLGLSPQSVPAGMVLRPDLPGVFPSVFPGLYAAQPPLNPAGAGMMMMHGERHGERHAHYGGGSPGAAMEMLRSGGQGLQLNVGGYGGAGLGLELQGSYGQGRGERAWGEEDT